MTIAACLDQRAEAAAVARDEPRVRTLVQAARDGDRAAFGELVVLYEHVVFRTALAALGSREDAEDAAQEAFIVAWQKLSGFREDATFRTWLLTIAWRKALDRRRVRQVWWRRTQPSVENDWDPLAAIEGPSPTPEEHALSRDLARRIRTEIRRLSPRLKDAFLLARTGEHTYEEIAAILRIPVGTLKWRVAEARRILGERLGA